jgi:hypothetical protein
MNSTRPLVPLAALALLLAAPLVGQTSVDSAGLLGKRYVGADFTYDQFLRSSLDQAMGASAVVNLPVAAALDVMVGYSYLDASGDNYGAIDKTLSASLVTHQKTEYGTGYFAGTLGHAWNNLGAPRPRHDNSALWGLRAGFEIPIGSRTAVNLGVSYSQAFDNNDDRAKILRPAAELNHWFSRDLAGVVSVAYKEVSRSPDAISYSLGLRWGF